MTDPAPERRVRRILVALDASEHSLAALDAAADLAADSEIELLGLFVEDTDLLRLAELPIGWVVSSLSGGRVAFQADDLLRDMRARARAAADAMAARGTSRRLRWSFTTTRGAPVEMLLAAAAGADLVSLGRAGWPRPGQALAGTTLQRFVAQSGASTLILAGGQRLGAPVVLWLDEDSSAERALSEGAEVALRLGGLTQALLVAGDPATDEARSAQVRETFGRSSLPVRLAYLPPGDATGALAAIAQLRPGLVVTSHVLASATGLALSELLAQLDCPLLLSR